MCTTKRNATQKATVIERNDANAAQAQTAHSGDTRQPHTGGTLGKDGSPTNVFNILSEHHSCCWLAGRRWVG
jgi:hypothetical protein